MAYAEVMRLVHLSPGGRPIVDLDLLAEAVYSRERNSLEIVPATEEVRSVSLPGRFGGTRPAGSAQANGQINWRTGVEGATHDQALANAGALVARVKETAPGRLLELKLGSATRPGYYDLRGPGAWTPTYRQSVFQRKRFWIFDVSLPVGPLVSRLPMDIYDDFAPMVDSGEVARNLVTNPRAAINTADWSTTTPAYFVNPGAVLGRASYPQSEAPRHPPLSGLTYFTLSMPNSGGFDLTGAVAQLAAPDGGVFRSGQPYTAAILLYPELGGTDVQLLLGPPR